MYPSDQLLPISALQHLIFCPRQCALIHVERLWIENALTAEGRALHERSHGGISESRGTIKTKSALPLASYKYGLIGESDFVEFHEDGKIIPIEHKRGQPKLNKSDTVQLCAQALCLEDMFQTEITEGYLFYNQTKRREHIIFDKELRELTLRYTAEFREMIQQRKTPVATYEKKCNSCSLIELCLPKISQKNAENYLQRWGLR